MSDIQLAIAPIFLPLAGAVLALFSKTLRSERLARGFETAGALVGLVLPWGVLAALLPTVLSGGVSYIIADWDPSVGIAQRFDGLSLLLNILTFAGTGTAYLYARGAGPKGPVFTAVLLIQTGALTASASTADLFNLFVCLEMAGLASYVLVAVSEKPGAFLAAFSYLAISSAAMVFFLIGLFGLYKLTGSLSYEGIAAGLSVLPASQSMTASASIACITAALIVRVAIMPMHGWLPDAHSLAPHAVSAVLSGVLLKIPLFALGRFLSAVPLGTQAMSLIGMGGAVTALLAVVLALAQKDAKRLLAYHSISQVGYIAAAWGVVSLSAAYQHALYHALFKGLLFLTVGTITDAAGTKDVYVLRNAHRCISEKGGARHIVLLSYGIAALSISALPPFNGFWSKNAVSYALTGSWAYWVLFAAGIGTVASFVKLSMIFMPAAAEPRGEPYTLAPPMKLAMILLALLCVGTGLFAGSFGAFCDRLLGAVSPSLPPIKSAALLKTALTALAGAALFLAVRSAPGKKIAARIRSRGTSFAGQLTAFVAALCAISIALRIFV